MTKFTIKRLAGLSLAVGLLIPVAVWANGLTAVIDQPNDGAEVKVGETVTFAGSASGGQSPFTYRWTFGDQTELAGQTVSRTFDQTGQATVTFRVTDSNLASDTKTINLTVVEEESKPTLTISNIQVSNITTTGATITWATNLPADSRVIYDTVSRPDISDQPEPNFGYANSTATFNEGSPVTSHSVTLTNLSPGTKYFFRVISRAEID